MSEPSLHRDNDVDLPGLIGARWWQSSVVDPIGRRKTLLTLLAVGGGVAVVGLLADACSPNKTGRRATLALQREYGWSFGASTESLVWNGQSTEPFNPDRLGSMVQELAPRVAKHRPFYVQTLFESPTALPHTVSPEDPSPIVPLKSVLRPIFTDSMKFAFRAGQLAVDSLASVPGTAVVVDLDGQDSVAFAAAACGIFDPIFLFDNWPHPRGVVPAHMTLAAAAYYQPLFAKVAETRGGDPPAMFVLDGQRLALYADAAEKFDNRWVARMPSPAALRALGVNRICYVAPSWRMPLEADDLNDDLVADHGAGISILGVDVRTIDLVLSAPRSAPLSSPTTPSPPKALGVPYNPTPRKTPFSSGAVGGTRPSPSDFGTVPVVLSFLGGALLGIAWSRSGSWNRSSSWGGGGG